MSSDLSNNNVTEPIINNTPLMETLDFFQYLNTRTTEIEHMEQIPSSPIPSNFISSFLNRMDNISNATNILSSLSSDTSSTDNDLSSNINYNNADVYIRFLEDILQLPPLRINNNNLSALLRETLSGDENPIKYVLSGEGEQKIETVEFDPEIYPNINGCPITIKDFKKGDMISKLPCNHLFNTDAILKWLKEEKAECPICRFKLESVEKNSKKSDSSYNPLQGNGVARPTNTIFPHYNTRVMHTFGPPRMPRRRHNAHLRRLMLSRHEQDEQDELQAALLASLEDKYMPGRPKIHKDDDIDSDIDSDISDIDSDTSYDSDEMDKVD